MKKVLILIIIILLGFMCYNVVIKGFEIAVFSILSLEQIQNENSNLDTSISRIEEIKATTYPAKLAEISSASKELLSQKKSYDELVAYSSEQEIIEASKGERYNIEVLWTKIGNYATSNGVIPKMELVSSSKNTPNANDLKFTVTGRYIAITDFIRDIEEDAKLGFTIEEFELVPVTEGDGTNLQATFKVKDIFINSETITTTSSQEYMLNNENTTNETINQTTTNNDANNAGQ